MEEEARALTDRENHDGGQEVTTDHTGPFRNRRLEPIAAHARKIWPNFVRKATSTSVKSPKEPQTVGAQPRWGRGRPAYEGAAGTSQVSSTLALPFPPRATAANSPFLLSRRPIQAMDPAKIDGFVQVLSRLPRPMWDRASHDDRLAAMMW
jgi:hypothetical protein